MYHSPEIKMSRTVRAQRSPITADCPSNVRAQSAPAGRTLRENRDKRYTSRDTDNGTLITRIYLGRKGRLLIKIILRKIKLLYYFFF